MTSDLTIQEFEVEKSRRIEELKKDCFAILDKGSRKLDEDFKRANEKLDAKYRAAVKKSDEELDEDFKRVNELLEQGYEFGEAVCQADSDRAKDFYIIIDGKKYLGVDCTYDFDGEKISLFVSETREHWWSWKRKKFRFRFDEMDIDWVSGKCTIKEVE